MADDDGGSSDVIQSDLGDFLNAADRIHTTVTLSIWTFVKSVITFVLAIVMVIIVAVLHIVPQIFTLMGHAIDLIEGVNLPTAPTAIPQGDWLNFANTFFPVQELFSCIIAYYTLYFTALAVRATACVAKFGYAVGVEVLSALKPI